MRQWVLLPHSPSLECNVIGYNLKKKLLLLINGCCCCYRGGQPNIPKTHPSLSEDEHEDSGDDHRETAKSHDSGNSEG